MFVADINADMRKWLVGIEEQQVAGLALLGLHRRQLPGQRLSITR